MLLANSETKVPVRTLLGQVLSVQTASTFADKKAIAAVAARMRDNPRRIALNESAAILEVRGWKNRGREEKERQVELRARTVVLLSMRTTRSKCNKVFDLGDPVDGRPGISGVVSCKQRAIARGDLADLR